MGVWAPTFSNALYSLLLLLSLVMCKAEKPILTPEFIHQVNNAIDDKTVAPFCFIKDLMDIACFWESNFSDTSEFTFYFKSQAQCNLTTMKASKGSWWHVCPFPQEEVSLFAITPNVISVWDNHSNTTLYRRELVQERIVYTDPPTNITIKEQKKPLGLLIIFKNTEKDVVLKDSLMYQVNYTNPKGQNLMVFHKEKVYEENGYVTLFLNGFKRDSEYTISVRAKADDPYDGYWSAWAVTTYQTSNGFDEIHISLFVIAGFGVVIAIFVVTVYQRSFLKSKVWPEIPSPEHHFKELYTTHKGNFKTWLGTTDSYLTWISRNIFHEGPITTLEVLSELPNAPPSFLPPVPLPPKDSYVVLDENLLPPLLAWRVSSRQNHVEPHLETEEKTTRREGGVQEGRPSDIEEVRERTSAEEQAINSTETMALKDLPGSRTIVRGDSLDSGDGKHSPASSFEYTVLETCDGLLSPRTRSIPPRQPLKYSYLLMSESGEESPPSSPNIYQNSLCGPFPAPVYSQC